MEEKKENSEFLEVKCSNCDTLLIYDFGGENASRHPTMPSIVDVSSTDNELDCWICTTCQRYYMVHRTCRFKPLIDVFSDFHTSIFKKQILKSNEFLLKNPEFCYLVGFSGWFVHPETKLLCKRFRYVSKDDKIIETSSLTEDEAVSLSSEQKLVFSLIDRRLTCLSRKGNLVPNGYSGEDPTFWKCRSCNKYLRAYPPRTRSSKCNS